MRDLFDRAVSAVLTCAAIAIAVSVVRREFFHVSEDATSRRSSYVDSWKDMLPASELIGPALARVRIVEFTDLQCPFCRGFNGALDAVRARFPSDVAVSVVHFPLPGHAKALPAARALECASAGGGLQRALDFFFTNQDSLGKQSWTWFAKGSGQADTVSFLHCMADTTTPAKVRAGIAMGAKAGITATPTVLINGWRYAHPPSDTELVRAVGDILAGRKPYSGFPTKALSVQ